MTATWRSTQKANRRARLLDEAAALFAARGFAAVTTAEIGEAVGMSGPALYKHFSSKDAILTELLVDASERLLAGCREILAARGFGGGRGLDADAAASVLADLIVFHIGFATAAPDIIRIQDRELAGLGAEASHRVRSLQRSYVDAWDEVLAAAQPGLSDAERQTRLLGVFGLLNSTPHSAAASGADAAGILAGMAQRALGG
ncbi:TetR/AcrR family transcriptional regulator [Microbacterium sp. bgisy203]|uniref:TetR/AcrR family transcriptional regulator n=1 Tax=Microbacterium sp. bgisy203 TaxID=3413799 RepID=UPI003D71027D